MKLVNDYTCSVKIGVQENPYQQREYRLCVTDDEIILSGTVAGYYMVFDFPLKKSFINGNPRGECACEEKEVGLLFPEMKGSGPVTLWITYQDRIHREMNHAKLNFEFGGVLCTVVIPSHVGEELARVSEGLRVNMVKCL